MNVRDNYSLHNVLKELEAVLQIDGIDYEEIDIERLLGNVKKRIEKQYQLDLSDTSYAATMINNTAYQGSLVIFIDNVSRVHSILCGYAQICRFTMEIPISLSSINYIGFTQESLREVLISAQVSSKMIAVSRAMEAIGEKLATLTLCYERRLLTCFYIAYELKLYELTSALAELLYISMLD